MEKKKDYIEVSLSGKSPALWREKRGKLMEKISAAVDALMDKIVDPIEETTVKEEAQEIISNGLKFIKSNLVKQTIENERTITEIKEVYARIEEISINNRKNLAEAEAQEFKNFLNKLEFSLGSTKLLFLSETDDESIVFIKQLESWIELIRTIKKHHI